MPEDDLNPEPFAHFSTFVHEQKKNYVGRDASDNAAEYIPLAVLQEYWTSKRISQVLYAFKPPLIFAVHAIKARYIRTFSTLVYCGKVRSLDAFVGNDLSDDRLPLRHVPPEWPNAPHFVDLFDKISDDQWMFFPLRFERNQLENRLLAPQCILPISSPQMIRQGDVASVQKIVIDDSCNGLVPKDRSGRAVQREFVLKSYYRKRFEPVYDNEIKALTMLMNTPSPHVISYFGSFRQQDSYNIILEFADGGNLNEYFRDQKPPQTAADIVRFWRSLFDVLKGLDRVHQLMNIEESCIRGIHEDIKPENIVLTKGPSGGAYDFTPKLADFGLFNHVRKSKKNSSEDMGLDNHGNQLYSSPECSHNATHNRSGPNWITNKADMFSIGAVMSDACAWVMGGLDAQIEYRRKRKAYHEKMRTFRKSDYKGCFHDGITCLPVVETVHKEITESCQQKSDRLTPRVIYIVQNHLLLGDASSRLKARNLTEKFEQLLGGMEPFLSPISPAITEALSSSTPGSAGASAGSTPTPSSPGVQTITSTPERVPTLSTPQPSRPAPVPIIVAAGASVADPNAAINRKDSAQSSAASSRADTFSSRPSSQSTVTIPQLIASVSKHRRGSSWWQGRAGVVVDPAVQQLVEILEHNLINRDQFFFIDDSTSMKDHSEVVQKAFEAISYIAKRLDPNKIELAFASDAKTVYKARRTTKLAKLISQHAFRHDPHLMEKSFGSLVDNVVVKYLPYRIGGFNVNPFSREISVYIFTDGRWGVDTKACGVQRPVERLMKVLNKRGLDKNQVSLHFVRFGEDESGKKHLAYLDGFGRKRDCDVVDVKHVSSNVTSMFYGSLSQKHDDEDEISAVFTPAEN